MRVKMKIFCHQRDRGLHINDLAMSTSAPLASSVKASVGHGITTEDNRAISRVKAIGKGFILACGECVVVRILRSRHLDTAILKDETIFEDVVRFYEAGGRFVEFRFSTKDAFSYRKIIQRSMNEMLGSVWAINWKFSFTRLNPVKRDYRANIRVVIQMVVRNKNGFDIVCPVSGQASWRMVPAPASII